jgi:hypothetical protein
MSLGAKDRKRRKEDRKSLVDISKRAGLANFGHLLTYLLAVLAGIAG